MEGLRAQGRGYQVSGKRVSIVTAAILFGLANGGAKDWDTKPVGSVTLGQGLHFWAAPLE